nr:cell division protein FtsY [Streptococcus thermophilus]
MNSTVLWIIVGVIVVLLIIVGIVVVVGNNRKKSKTVSFDKAEPEEPKELTQQEKSGNYQAKGGFNFAPAGAAAAEKEPVRVDEPLNQPKPAESETAAAAASAEPDAVVDVDGEPVADDDIVEVEETVNELDTDEPVVEEELLQDELVDGVDAEGQDVGKPLGAMSADPGTSAAEDAVPAQVHEDAAGAAEPATPVNQTAEEEAEEAAEIARTTADVAEEARAQTPVPQGEPAPQQEPLDDIAPAAGRIGRLRGRLSRSQNAIGQGLLGILTAGDLDEDAWEEIEDTLIMADLGAELTMKVTENLRAKIAERGVASEAEARAMLRETLVEAGRPELDRSIKAMPNEGKPAVILVVGVNGTGKTTTTGKLARVLISMGHRVVLGAADTFRAAAADQLETWGRRVGASTVRGAEGADPAAVAFDAVKTGVEEQADVVIIDTAGRLHTSTGLMDQLGKVKRVVEKKSEVDEVLLVLDATVGQNGLMQARVFKDVVEITGVALTKLDGTAKGGIVFQVQEELGVPVKLVGLGEGADDLAPFEVEGFVDALLGTSN